MRASPRLSGSRPKVSFGTCGDIKRRLFERPLLGADQQKTAPFPPRSQFPCVYDPRIASDAEPNLPGTGERGAGHIRYELSEYRFDVANRRLKGSVFLWSEEACGS